MIHNKNIIISEHTKPPESSPEGDDSPTGKESPDLPTTDNRELKSPLPTDAYLHNSNLPESMTTIPVHDMSSMPYANNNDGRIMQQPFSFSQLLMPPPQLDNGENLPTDLRVMSSKNVSNICPCASTAPQRTDEPQNLAYRAQCDSKVNSDNSDNDSDAEIDLTSHSSKDDDLRDSERLASRIANSIFRSAETVLHDMVPNDLSLTSMKGIESRNGIQM